MANFYIVLDRNTAWGIGKTRKQAVQNAAQRVPGQNNEQGIPFEEMGALIESRHAVENGSGGYYLEPISFEEWDERLDDLDGKALAKLAWEQQGYNYITNQISPY